MLNSAADQHARNVKEEMWFGIAANELANGNVSRGIYAKAMVEADGDTEKAKLLYLKLRVEGLRVEAAAHAEKLDYERRLAEQEQQRLYQAKLAQLERAEQEQQQLNQTQLAQLEQIERNAKQTRVWKKRSMAVLIIGLVLMFIVLPVGLLTTDGALAVSAFGLGVLFLIAGALSVYF